MKEILPNHPQKKSRDVTEKDLEVVIRDSMDLFKICHKRHGIHKRAYAMAHPQIESKDPLRFFVTESGMGYINPKILKEIQPYKRREGCMSFKDHPAVEVERFNIIEVEFIPFMAGGGIDMKNVQRSRFSALTAAVFQHEIGHFDVDLVHEVKKKDCSEGCSDSLKESSKSSR